MACFFGFVVLPQRPAACLGLMWRCVSGLRLLATPRPHGGHDYGHDMNAASFDGPDILKVAAVRWRPAITAPPAVPHQAAHELHHQTAHSACSHAPHYMWHTSNKGFSSRGGVCIDRGGFVDSNIPSEAAHTAPAAGLALEDWLAAAALLFGLSMSAVCTTVVGIRGRTADRQGGALLWLRGAREAPL